MNVIKLQEVLMGSRKRFCVSRQTAFSHHTLREMGVGTMPGESDRNHTILLSAPSNTPSPAPMVSAPIKSGGCVVGVFGVVCARNTKMYSSNNNKNAKKTRVSKIDWHNVSAQTESSSAIECVYVEQLILPDIVLRDMFFAARLYRI